jgi:hypothetical protein
MTWHSILAFLEIPLESRNSLPKNFCAPKFTQIHSCLLKFLLFSGIFWDFLPNHFCHQNLPIHFLILFKSGNQFLNLFSFPPWIPAGPARPASSLLLPCVGRAPSLPFTCRRTTSSRCPPPRAIARSSTSRAPSSPPP